MAKGHRSQIKKERNEANREKRPHASAKYVGIPASKAKIVLDQIKGKDVATAKAILEYNPRYASGVIKKLLDSAIANAENNYPNTHSDKTYNVENLYIAECYANKGPTMKRVHPRAKGRAYRIEKRMSHITIVLDEK